MRVLGIDPGSRITGYGVIERNGSTLRWLASGVIRTGDGELADRLARIHRELDLIVTKWGPETAALEAVFSHRNVRSALLLAQARGVALGVCGLLALPTTEYAPTAVKNAVVGYGGAAKSQVQMMVQRILSLKKQPSKDEADALAVAVCHAHTVGSLRRAKPNVRGNTRLEP